MKLYCALVVLGSAMAAPGHRFACADYTQGKVFVVDSAGRVEWSYDAPNANDIWALPNGDLLFNTGHGVKEVTRDRRRVVWSFADHGTMKTISSVQILDVAGDAIAGTVLH